MNETAPVIEELFSAEEIMERTQELARDIEEHYDWSAFDVVVLLRSGWVFSALLAQEFETMCIRYQFVEVGKEWTGEAKLLGGVVDLTSETPVLVVDALVETGETLSGVVDRIRDESQGQIEVATCVLLDCPRRRIADVRLDFVGFSVPERTIVGFGLDYHQHFRGLSYVGYLNQ